MYSPKIGDRVVVDSAVMKAWQKKRIGTIINVVERVVGDSRQYEKIFIIRTDYNDCVQARYGQFITAKRRLIDANL